MAWEWSHTNEAYADAKRRLEQLDEETLAEIWAEWLSHGSREDSVDFGGGFDSEAYPGHLAAAKELPGDVLAEAIWDKAAEYRTCSNGGWEAYMCPFHCGPHSVSFGE